MNDINEKNILSFQSRGILYEHKSPIIMGIMNCTPDSYYAESRYTQVEQALDRVGNMLEQGLTMLDIGGQSTRPGAEPVLAQEEMDRILPYVEALIHHYPQLFVSIDTYQSQVARHALELGAHCINDISAGTLDPAMLKVVSEYKVPYVIMHMQGNPQTMQIQPKYQSVVTDIIRYLAERKQVCQEWGIQDIWVDPGFGFGKTLEQNYQIFNQLHAIRTLLDAPLLVGISRKSMIYKLLNITPQESLSATSALHLQALMQGAQILRVHDVKEASEVLQLYKQLQNTESL